MTKELLVEMLRDFSDNSPLNYLSPQAVDPEEIARQSEELRKSNYFRNNYYGDDPSVTALNQGKEEKYIGLRFFGEPILAIGSAKEENFRILKDPVVVGPHHLLPEDWLPGAKTVISIFLPFTERVISSNCEDPNEPSMEWLFTRVDGQQHLLATGALVKDALIREGYQAIVPYADDRFIMKVRRNEDLPIPAFSSNWSERHVAYITGLGTFGRHTNFISRKGCCGRLVSVITDWETVPDEKDYSDRLDYCSDCGACYRNCPAGALSEEGKDIDRCSAYLNKLSQKFAPRYGCGKCQSGLPCSIRNLHISSKKG